MKQSAQILAAVLLLAACERREAPSVPAAGAAAAPSPGADTAPHRMAEPAIPFTIVSDIADCLEVVTKGTTTDANLLLAVVGLKTTRITAACGCTSKWLLYRSVISTQGIETEFASGSLLTGDPGGPEIERRVVLLGERGHALSEPMTVHVGCAPAP